MKRDRTTTELRQIIQKRTTDLPDVNLELLESSIVAADTYPIASALEQVSLVCKDKSLIDPQWSILSGRLMMEIIHNYSGVPKTFSETTMKMKPILDKDYYEFVMNHKAELDELVRLENDFRFEVFSVATLQKSYLAHLKVDGKSILMETPQFMYLRVATFLRRPNISDIKLVYNALSNGEYSHATPTLFNAGMRKPQLSSCFLNSISDNMEGLSKSWHDTAIISMNSGGVGTDYGNIRHSEIGQHGFSRGIVPWLKITNEILKTIDQGGKRPGSGTMYLRDWHVDVYEFVELRSEGPEDLRAKDLFLGLMVSDLFMKRVEKDENWSLFCPNRAKGLTDVWGQKFEAMYIELEEKGLASRVVKARDLWTHILNMQILKGMPFILYIDACNSKSNQQHAGMIRQSNLCTEICLNTSPEEIASCTLASMSLCKCVEYNSATGRMSFNFDKLEFLTAQLVQNLNKVIDYNYYPPNIPEIKISNMRHRPLGIGAQGLADTFALLDIAWVEKNESGDLVVSQKAQKLNDQIFETMYFSAVKESIEIAKKEGFYPSFPGSPSSKGIFQFDMWNTPMNRQSRYTTHQWDVLRNEMMKHGLRNSTLLSIMPTASSAHILGNMEACEAFTEMIYARTVLAGQFIVVNKHLIRDLKLLDLWNDETIKSIISERGSLKGVTLPNSDPREKKLDFLRLKYLTAFEIPQKVVLQLTADRGKYICQTQSTNCFMPKPTKTQLNAYHFYGWKLGLKTGMYYLRQKALTDPINFASDTKIIPNDSRKKRKVECVDKDGTCMACNV